MCDLVSHDRAGHDPLPHRRPPGVLGEVRARGEGIGREEEGQELHRATATPTWPGSSATPPRPPARTDTFLGERYRRIARRRGANKAIVAVGRSILVIIWHLLSDPEARYTDLGAGFYASRIDPDRRRRNHVRQLEALGYKVILERAA